MKDLEKGNAKDFLNPIKCPHKLMLLVSQNLCILTLKTLTTPASKHPHIISIYPHELTSINTLPSRDQLHLQPCKTLALYIYLFLALVENVWCLGFQERGGSAGGEPRS